MNYYKYQSTWFGIENIRFTQPEVFWSDDPYEMKVRVKQLMRAGFFEEIISKIRSEVPRKCIKEGLQELKRRCKKTKKANNPSLAKQLEVEYVQRIKELTGPIDNFISNSKYFFESTYKEGERKFLDEKLHKMLNQ